MTHRMIPMFAVGVLSACGNQIAGMPGDTGLGELSDQQDSRFCTHLIEIALEVAEDEETIRAECILASALTLRRDDADPEEALRACEMRYHECTEFPVTPEAGGLPESEAYRYLCFSGEARRSCNASIAEISACTRAKLEAEVEPIQRLSDMTCEEAATAKGQAKLRAVGRCSGARHRESERIPDIEACQPVREKCPDL